MASTLYQGKALRFSFNGKTLYHATSCKMSISTKLEGIASKDTDGTISTPSNYEWSMSTEALVANKVGVAQSDFYDIMKLQLIGAEIDVAFKTGVTGDVVWTGKCYVESSDVTSEVGSVVTGSISFKGNGNLVPTTAV